MYAHLLHAMPDVLLYAGSGVWVERTVFLQPTRRIEGGFCAFIQTPPFESRDES